MFNSARLKLTIWYLLVLMLISISFSAVIFRVEMFELDRLAHSPRFRIPDEVIEETISRHLTNLMMINIGILVIAGTSGYFLAGRTLKPIADMVDEQNRFIGDASHELRTPLTALKSALEVNLKDKNLLKDCLGEVNKLQYLSESLLNLAQYQKPNKNIKIGLTSIPEVLKEAIHSLDAKAIQKNITIKNLSKKLEVKGDKYSLVDLFVIILDNAIKYSPKDSTITINSQKIDNLAVVTVLDSGIGIEKKDLPHVFDRFYRADLARGKKTEGGYGLGLAIAKKIVESHSGSIGLESKLNAGTKVIVKLPVNE